jgi:hypothetical protein
VLLASCSTQWRYSKQGVSQQQVNQDGYECRRQATYQTSNAQVNPYGGTASSGPQLDIPTMKACLRARGYTITKV